ncbi:unnamed protein product [Pleuronectes platessa]|uniref:Uncharacterized protein n=1 Tax=Pleuronectes platessa TaxID=8262 RepID=A0A9N7YXI3_PLEPL|nr:unnamed protein product [Pleuronectes platessa]
MVVLQWVSPQVTAPPARPVKPGILGLLSRHTGHDTTVLIPRVVSVPTPAAEGITGDRAAGRARCSAGPAHLTPRLGISLPGHRRVGADPEDVTSSSDRRLNLVPQTPPARRLLSDGD